MRRFLTLLGAMLLLTVSVTAQNSIMGKVRRVEKVCDVNDIIPAHIEINGSTQGFAIYRNYAFSMHDKGQCVIFDLKKQRFINTFVLEGNTGHCNNASFGVERYSNDSQFPLFYVTECRGNRACYVNDISTSGSRLVQTIYYDGLEIEGPCDWAVDAKKKHIYLYCTINKVRTLKWFPLPKLSDSDHRSEVHLRPEDALGSVPAGNIQIPQGSLITKRHILLAEGIPPRHTALNAIDKASGIKIADIDFDYTGLEPEGIATRRAWIYLSFHTPRQPRHNIIYRMRLRR